MVFLTNNLAWSAVTICELYRSRWQIEVFFKQLKQTVQLVDFMGNSANAVKWQIWTALLTHLLLRYLAWQSSWDHSFSRLNNNLRAALWMKLDLYDMLARYGTAGGSYRSMRQPEQGWLRGLEPEAMG
jgi:IS4 transposase